MWDRIGLDIGIIQSLDSIFAGILVGGIDRSKPENNELVKRKVMIAKVNRARFIANFPFNIFNNCYAIFYEIITTLNMKAFSLEQLEAIIDNNKDLILESPYIDKSIFDLDGNANENDIIMAMTQELKDKLVSLSYNEVDEDEYISACKLYSTWYRDKFMEYTSQNMAIIMSDMGYTEKKPNKKTKFYKGYESAVQYYNDNMQIIRALEDGNNSKSIVIDSNWYANEIAERKSVEDDKLFKIGIKEMDATIGILRRGMMLGILGAPKGGKTRFANYLVGRALSLGFNVCVWALEGSKEEWIATQTAYVIADTSFNEMKKGRTSEFVRIPSKIILDESYNGSQEIRKAVLSAKMTLSSDEKRGRLSFIDSVAHEEDFLDVLKAHYENDNPFDVLVIDPLINIQGKKGKSKVERISDAYINLKQFLVKGLKRPALGIIPAQLKQDVVDYIRMHPDETLDVTAGGESSETIRTPDETVGLFSSKEERNANIMKFYSVASRHNASFDDFSGRCYLDSCYFMSEEDDISIM